MGDEGETNSSSVDHAQESIDLDDVDDDEGRRLDVALSEAFKNVRKPQNKTKKQSPTEKALTNFRIRFSIALFGHFFAMLDFENRFIIVFACPQGVGFSRQLFGK